MMRFSLIALLLCIWASASHAYQFGKFLPFQTMSGIVGTILTISTKVYHKYIVTVIVWHFSTPTQISFTELRGGQICKGPYKQLFTERGWRCYAFYQQEKTFADAKDHCIAEGGMLATIHSDKVYNFIVQNIKTLKPVPVLSSWGKLFTKWSRGYWLGSTKIGGIYQWFDQGQKRLTLTIEIV